MSSLARPPDPCLVAIILIVRSRAGPRLVFHYPPSPLSENAVRPSLKGRRVSRAKASQKTKPSDSDISDQTGATSDEDEEDAQLGGSTATTGSVSTQRGGCSGLDDHPAPTSTTASSSTVSSGGRRRRGEGADAGESGKLPQDDKQRDAGLHQSDQSILGLQADVWEKLLSPPPAWHKRRFEVGINDLAFIGWPVFVREDGTWRKEKRKKKEKKTTTKGQARHAWEGSELARNEDTEETKSGWTIPSDEGPGCRDSDSRDSMTMFNVVFVLDPPLLEYSVRVREIYDNVIKKLAKALKWEQARTDYVWKESQHILHIKEAAKEKGISASVLHTELISQSSLARAIYIVYSSISASKIASVSLDKDISISLQIPPLTPTPYLPGPADKAYPGLWLTTADSVNPADEPVAEEGTATHQVLAKHFALLLLDNEATILKDVQASGGALGPALARYIQCSKPTKSFAQISTTSGIPLPTIQMLASHLVYWRRARAIPPLHQRDTYIVSPNCDLSKLGVATAAYQSTFPTLPSLAKMLSALSGTPRPYGSLIPSKDHKEAYFAILAWLLRGGWVTQLRTYCRIKVSPKVKKAVDTAVRREELDRYLNQTSEREKISNSSEDSGYPSSSVDSQGSGDETPVPGRQNNRGGLGLMHSLLDQDAQPDRSSFILAPHRASPLESRWMDEILARASSHFALNVKLKDTLMLDETAGGLGKAAPDSVLKKHWPIFIQYFNGYDALEKIPVREGLKRKLVWQIIGELGGTIGHQRDECRLYEHALVSVRHW